MAAPEDQVGRSRAPPQADATSPRERQMQDILRQLATQGHHAGSTLQALLRSPNPPPPPGQPSPHVWEAERRYQALVEKVPAVTFIASLAEDVHELYVSPQIEELLGFSQAEWLENPFLWYTQLHPDDRAQWAEEFARTCAVGVNFRSEYRLLSREGRVVWVHGDCQVIRDQDDQPLFLMGIAFDITDRKRAEEALRVSEARFRSLLETAPDAMVIVDHEGRIALVNQQAETLFGYRREELLGQEVERLMPGRFHAAHVQHRKHYTSHAALRPMGSRMPLLGRRKDGTEFPVEISLGPLQSPDGPLVSAVIRDVTERRRAEQRTAVLAEAGRLVSESFDYASTLRNVARVPIPAFADWSLIDVLRDDGTTMYAAAAHADPAKHAIMEALRLCPPHKPFSFLIGTQAMQRGIPVLLTTVTPDMIRPHNGDSEHLRLIRELNPQSVLCVPLTARGKNLAFWTFVYSAPGRRYSQEDVPVGEELARRAALLIDNARLYQQAEAASRAKDQFLAVLSHELRTPLNPVLMVIGQMERNPLLSEELRQDLRMVHRNVQLEARLIDDLLDLTRIARGKLALTPSEIDLKPELEQTLWICSADLIAKNLQLRKELEPAAHLVWGDAARLQQVFWNLLRNAIKFTPAGGDVVVRCFNDGPRVVTEVSDTGVGIDPAVLPRIFDPFEQGGPVITREFGGLGLGLAISKALVDLHGGQISAQSPGRRQGATFHVVLPLVSTPITSPSTRSPSPAAQRPQKPRRPRILLVEDHPDTAQVLSRLLRREGHDVRVAGNIATAMELSEHERFDVLVSDLGLPDGSGLDLIVSLRMRQPSIHQGHRR